MNRLSKWILSKLWHAQLQELAKAMQEQQEELDYGLAVSRLKEAILGNIRDVMDRDPHWYYRYGLLRLARRMRDMAQLLERGYRQ
ncbi:MAG TPA: hypothetical protein VM537_15730 [Anaerolineae bacterium]|nr:hypothetical protein [Anaerolineae bacterium]